MTDTMAWDSKRPIPWRRLGIYLAIYALAMVGITAITGKADVGQLARSLLVGVPVAGLAVVILAKFGYLLPILKGRDVLAAERAERLAARQAARGGNTAAPVEAVEGPRPRPPVTRRTAVGHSQHPTKKPRRKR
jgi:hypothetical protein